MTVHEAVRGAFRSRHLTVRAPAAGSVLDSATSLFHELAASVIEQGIEPLQEKVYGPISEERFD